MTISGTATDIVVDGDGLTSTFNYDFYMGGSSAYAVLVFTDTDGTQTTIAAADFTITGVTSQSGGTFTYPLVGSPIAVSTTLTLSRVLPLVQSAAVGNQSNFYPSVVEGALDYQMMVAQQLSGGAAGTIDAASLFGNSGASSGAGTSIPIGSGLSFSGNTLVVSGVSGSGTVTSVATGDGLTGGPVTGVGTISLSSITASSVLANPTTASAVPTSVVLGGGLSFTNSTTLTSSAGMHFITSSSPTATASVTFTIPQTYTHFEIRGIGRSTAGATPGVNVAITFNGDGGANYDSPQWQIVNQTGGGNSVAGSTSISLVAIVPWSSSTANNFGAFKIEGNSYTGSTFKSGLIAGTSIGSTSVDGAWVQKTGGFLWRSTASITTVSLTLAAGNWTAGSQISLYGLS